MNDEPDTRDLKSCIVWAAFLNVSHYRGRSLKPELLAEHTSNQLPDKQT